MKKESCIDVLVSRLTWKCPCPVNNTAVYRKAGRTSAVQYLHRNGYITGLETRPPWLFNYTSLGAPGHLRYRNSSGRREEIRSLYPLPSINYIVIITGE